MSNINLNFAAGKGGVYSVHPYITQTTVDANTVCLLTFNALSGHDATGTYTPTFQGTATLTSSPLFPWLNGTKFNGSNNSMQLASVFDTVPTTFSLDFQFSVNGTLPAGENPILQKNWNGNDVIYVHSMGGDTGAIRVAAVMGGSNTVYSIDISAPFIADSGTQSWKLSGRHTLTYTCDGTLLTIYCDGNCVYRALPTGTFFGGGAANTWSFAGYTNNSSNTPITFWLGRFSNSTRSYAEHVQIHNQYAAATDTCRTRWKYVCNYWDTHSSDYVANNANGAMQEPTLLFIGGTYYLWAHVGIQQPFTGLWTGSSISSLTYYGNVLGQGVGGESAGVAVPYVYYENGIFYQYYRRTTNNSTEATNGTGIYVATSTDGKTWGSNALSLACPQSGNGQFNTNIVSGQNRDILNSRKATQSIND